VDILVFPGQVVFRVGQEVEDDKKVHQGDKNGNYHCELDRIFPMLIFFGFSGTSKMHVPDLVSDHLPIKGYQL
jgi:hypothetical protein